MTPENFAATPPPRPRPRLDQITLTDPSGAQTLLDVWESGEVEVSWREQEGEGWSPSEIVGIEVKVKRGVQ